VRVRWKLTAATDYTNVVILPAGSVQYTIGGLVPGSAYTVEVAHLDLAPFSGAGTVATDTWTACGDVPVLDPPIDPLGFSNGAGTYGMEVTGTEFPSNTVFEEAIETAAGSGIYDAYAVVASPETTAGRIHFESFRANDGLTVRIRAKHTRSGWTDSAYTTPVIVDPWGDPDPVPPGGGVSIADAVDTVPIWSAPYNSQREFGDWEDDAALTLKFSLDNGATWDDFGAAATPTLDLDTAGDRITAWAIAVDDCTGDPLFNVFHADGTEADPAWRFRRPMGDNESARIQCRVSRAGAAGVAPRIKDVIVQFWNSAAAVEPPSEEEPEEPTFEFPTDDLVIDYRSYAGVTVDMDDVVTLLEDQHAPQTNPFSYHGEPTVIADVVNGLPVIRFSGEDWFRLEAAYAGRSAGHLFMAIKMLSNAPLDPADGGIFEFGPLINSNYYPYTPDGKAYLDYGSTVRHDFSIAAVNVAQWHVLEIEAEDGYWAYRYNGTTIHETPTNTWENGSITFIGRGSTLEGIKGKYDLVRFLDFDARLSADDAAAVRAHLYNLIGIAP
jgi:hypothetical protein